MEGPVLVALPGGPEGDLLVERASEEAARTGSVPVGVHVTVSRSGPPAVQVASLARQRERLEEAGGRLETVAGTEVAPVLLGRAAALGAGRLIVGAGTSRQRARLAAALAEGAPAMAVQVVAVPTSHSGRTVAGALSRRRRLLGGALACMLLPAVTLLCLALGNRLDLGGELLVYLAAVLAVAVAGGLVPGLAAAVGATLLLNYFFTAPTHTWQVRSAEDVVALGVFVVVAALVSQVVDLAERRSVQAARAGAEARILSALAGDALRGESAMPALLERARDAFGVAGAAVLAPAEGGGWRVLAAAGLAPDTPAAGPSAALDERRVLALSGAPTGAVGPGVLAAVAAQLAVALRTQELAEAARAAAPLAEADRVRVALLGAVSHDLRTPLATATAAVSSLTDPEISWSDGDRAELTETAAAALRRLQRVVEDLLDASRLQAGVVSVFPRALDLGSALARALDHLALPAGAVLVRADGDVPPAWADPGLLERVLANLVQNAVRHAPATAAPVVSMSCGAGDRVVVEVADSGPGIPAADRERVFTPFQRLGDRGGAAGAGVGLGLAVARGLTEANGGSLTLHATPGGGTTVRVELPAAVGIAAR